MPDSIESTNTEVSEYHSIRCRCGIHNMQLIIQYCERIISLREATLYYNNVMMEVPDGAWKCSKAICDLICLTMETYAKPLAVDINMIEFPIDASDYLSDMMYKNNPLLSETFNNAMQTADFTRLPYLLVDMINYKSPNEVNNTDHISAISNMVSTN